MGYERAQASARRMIAAKGQACLWRKPAAQDDAADEWRDVREGDPTDTACSIAWFAPRDLGRGTENFLSAIAGQNLDVPDGYEIGLMAAGDFEPLPSDKIVKGTDPDGAEIAITTIDRLAPDGTPIFYFVKVKR
jgi:hypothetical protein